MTFVSSVILFRKSNKDEFIFILRVKAKDKTLALESRDNDSLPDVVQRCWPFNYEATLPAYESK